MYFWRRIEPYFMLYMRAKLSFTVPASDIGAKGGGCIKRGIKDLLLI